MPKSVEQRSKEINVKQSFLVATWNGATSSFKKELSAPIFKRDGDIAGLASRFDTTQEKFVELMQKKDDAKKPFLDVTPQLQKLRDRVGSLKKELDGLGAEASRAWVPSFIRLDDATSYTPDEDGRKTTLGSSILRKQKAKQRRPIFRGLGKRAQGGIWSESHDAVNHRGCLRNRPTRRLIQKLP